MLNAAKAAIRRLDPNLSDVLPQSKIDEISVLLADYEKLFRRLIQLKTQRAQTLSEQDATLETTIDTLDQKFDDLTGRLIHVLSVISTRAIDSYQRESQDSRIIHSHIERSLLAFTSVSYTHLQSAQASSSHQTISNKSNLVRTVFGGSGQYLSLIHI